MSHFAMYGYCDSIMVVSWWVTCVGFEVHDGHGVEILCEGFGVPQNCKTKCRIELAIFFGNSKETPCENINLLS